MAIGIPTEVLAVVLEGGIGGGVALDSCFGTTDE